MLMTTSDQSSQFICIHSKNTTHKEEYQKDTGNLSHMHLMLQILWDELNDAEKAFFMRDIIRTSNNETIRLEEVDDLINEEIFKSYDDWIKMLEKTS